MHLSVGTVWSPNTQLYAAQSSVAGSILPLRSSRWLSRLRVAHSIPKRPMVNPGPSNPFTSIQPFGVQIYQTFVPADGWTMTQAS